MYTYWRFYWPLALTGIGLVLSVQFQNATLARYPEAVTELAVLALAYGVYGFFNAGLQFISQLSNVFARSPSALQRTGRFVIGASLAVMSPLLLIAISPPGDAMIGWMFSIDQDLVAKVSAYLLLMCPLVLLNAQRHFLTGLLIQARLTGWVTLFNFIYLGVVIAALIAGFHLALSPMHVIVGSETLGVCVLIVCLLVARTRLYRLPDKLEHADVTYRELTSFFIPVSTTGVMFALSRPVLFAFVARAPDGLLTIAALRVAFDFTMLFQQAANQFRHFFISFGFDDMRKKQQFMVVVWLGLTLIMLVFAVTPLADWIWGRVMGLPDQLIALSTEVLLVMCLMPAAIIYRNYFHSRLMHMRRTAGMAWGSMTRVLGILACAWVLFQFGLLDHITAGATLIAGFIIEAAVAQWSHHRVSLKQAPVLAD